MRVWISIFAILVSGVALAQGKKPEKKEPGLPMYTAASMGPLELLQRPDVRSDLALSDEVKAKLAAIRLDHDEQYMKVYASREKPEVFREKTDALRKSEIEQMGAVLTSEQKDRLRQIQLQLLGGSVLTDPEVSSQLAITADQQTRLKSIEDKRRIETKAIFDDIRSRKVSYKKGLEAISKRNKDLGDEMMKVLTAEQSEKLKSLLGKPFKAG